MQLKVRGFWSMPLLFITLFLAASNALAAGSATITTPTNNSALPPSPDYNITGTASGSGLTKVEVSFDRGGSWSTATGTTSWNYTWKAPIPLGSYSILSRATDSSGTGSPVPGTHVVVDGTAPSTSVTSPSASSYLKGTVITISGTAADTGGVNKVEVSTDGGSTWKQPADGVTDTSGNGSWSSWSYLWTLSADGGYTIKSRATDAAGNSGTSAGVTVTVDKTAPTVSAGANKTANALFTQTATASDASAMTYSWTKQAGTGTITFGTPMALSTTVSASADGAYTLRFTATDAAGNSAYSDMTLTWDSTAPSTSVTAPSANAYLSGTSCIITGTASDGGSGLQKAEVGITSGSNTVWTTVAVSNNNWSYTWSPLPANGSYTMQARGTDNAGNVGTSAGVPVSITNALGTVVFDKSAYSGPRDNATVTVVDMGASLNAGPGNDSISVKVTSASDVTGELITLREDPVVEGRFSGTCGFEPLKAFAGNGKVYVSKGDTVTATYTDTTTPSGASQDVTATAAWDSGRTMWLSNASDIINNVGTARADLFAFCPSPHGNSAARIDTVYIDAASAINNNSTFLRSFISDAHSRGLRLECLMGAPSWATSSGLATAASTIDAATSFNDAGNANERFDGIHLDVDPSLLSNWQTQTASVWGDFITLLNSCRSKVGTYDSSGHDLTLAVDMPSWYDTAYPGITSSDSVQDMADYVVVKAGSDTAQGIASAVQHEMDYAQAIGKKAFIGAETACGTYPDSATFCEEGYTVMDQVLGSVAQGFQANKSFMGAGINDYQAYGLLNQLPNSPITGITDPANGATINGTSYTVKGTASSVVGVQKVEVAVSTDGGTTWNPAGLVTDTSGNGSWSSWNCSWTLPAAGSCIIRAWATDTLGGVETPGASISVQVVDKKHLTTSVSPAASGSVTGNPASADGYYSSGTTVGLTAAPASGYAFTGWSGDASGTGNPVNIAMDTDKTVTANFKVKRYLTLGVTAGGSATASPDHTADYYLDGDAVSITATPASGYVFTGWSGDASGSANPLNVTMSSNKTITAVFKAKYTLTVTVSGNGTVSPSPAPYYIDGDTVTLTANPSSSCVQFTGWSGDATGTTNPLTVTMNTNKVITANFATIRYNLTTAVNDPAGGSVTPGGVYDCGSGVTITATANPGYVFTGWSGSATGTANPLGVTMNSDMSVTANFKRQGIGLVYTQSGTSVTLTATMYYNGSPASGKKITFYEGTVAKGIKNTNTSGVAVLTFTSTLGAHTAYAGFTASGGIPSMTSNTVAYTIGKVILASPANGAAATSTTLSWQQYTGATLYHVQVATSSKFGSGTLSATTTGTSMTSPMALVHGKTYYWRAYADIPSGTTAYSDTWKFTY